MRRFGRLNDQLRETNFSPSVMKYAEGACLAQFGDTHVLCTATVEEKVPFFLRNTGAGWVTAEYGMLPRATQVRVDREAARGKQSGRTQEIQRLIGRSLRMALDLKALGERQIKIDCDVLQADGGTRTASICGGYIALAIACHRLVKKGDISRDPIKNQVAAISCGIVEGSACLDLDYLEDSQAAVDANFILTGRGQIIEIQTTAESAPFEEEELHQMLHLARKGIQEIIQKQQEMINFFRGSP